MNVALLTARPTIAGWRAIRIELSDRHWRVERTKTQEQSDPDFRPILFRTELPR